MCWTETLLADDYPSFGLLTLSSRGSISLFFFWRTCSIHGCIRSDLWIDRVSCAGFDSELEVGRPTLLGTDQGKAHFYIGLAS